MNISSVVGVHGNWGQTNYAASKAGIIGFTKSLARELGSRQRAGPTSSRPATSRRKLRRLPEDATAAMLQNTLLGRLGEPETSPGGTLPVPPKRLSFITGEVLLVDGGLGM